MSLQWATYRDAADECGVSRIYGGIHPYIDDFPGRIRGAAIGPQALSYAETFYFPQLHKSRQIQNGNFSVLGEPTATIAILGVLGGVGGFAAVFVVFYEVTTHLRPTFYRK